MTTRTKLLLCFAGVALLALALPLMFSPHALPKLIVLGMGLGLVGTTVNELARVSDVLLFEEGEEVNWVREAVTVISGTVASKLGQVLGKITIGAATSAAKSGGNTGAGTLVMDVTTPILVGAQVGIYTVRVLAVGTFIVKDPNGSVVGDATYGAGATVTFSDQIKFAFADDASTHYVAGDGFDITIAAGSGKYTQVTPAAVDGSAVAVAVLLTDAFTATLGADKSVVAVTRGPAIMKANGLQWTSGMSAPQIATATAQLATHGILVRTDYGV